MQWITFKSHASENERHDDDLGVCIAAVEKPSNRPKTVINGQNCLKSWSKMVKIV